MTTVATVGSVNASSVIVLAAALMTNTVKAVVTTVLAADSTMTSVRAVVLMTTSRVSAVSMMTTVHVADLTTKKGRAAVLMMTNLVANAVSKTVPAADSIMTSVPAVASMTTNRVSVVFMTTIGRVVDSTMSVPVVDLMMTDDDDRPRRRFDEDRPRGGNRRFDDRPRRRFDDEEEPRRGRKGYVREKDPLYDRPKATGEIRLNKYLADCGICSRREADDLIKAGCVMVNDEVITTMGYKVKTEDKVVYGGQTLNREKLRYILLNKPKGYITTSDDPYERDTVMELVKDACPERIFPVGRLDKQTTGLLLFTNDGDLAKKLTHPSSEIPKLYHVILDKPLTKNDMLRISEGIELDDGPIAADNIAYDQDDDSKKSIGIELHSGRNRIVRRIFEHLGYEVTKLDRVMFAGLDKYKLPRGEWRFLTDLEVMNLKKI